MLARNLQREQSTLYSIEKQLVAILPHIQEGANSLKVEELHLRSLGLQLDMAAEQFHQQPVSCSRHTAQLHAQQNMYINKQEIDLDMYVAKLEQFDEENDSDTE